MIFCSKDPESNKFITEDEKNYLRKEIGMLERDTTLPSTPFKKILTSVPVWAIIISQTGIDFSFYVMTTDLPKYLADVMRIDVERNGLYSSLPQVLNFFSAMAFGLLSDICINKEYLSVRNTRRLFTTTGEFKLCCKKKHSPILPIFNKNSQKKLFNTPSLINFTKFLGFELFL